MVRGKDGVAVWTERTARRADAPEEEKKGVNLTVTKSTPSNPLKIGGFFGIIGGQLNEGSMHS